MYLGSIKKVRKGEVIFDVVWLMVPDVPIISETADLLGSSHTTISRFTVVQNNLQRAAVIWEKLSC